MAREFEWLAKAIVFQAYKDALVGVILDKLNSGRYLTAKHSNEALKFIGSEWYYELTDIDHKTMLRVIQERANGKGVNK